MILSLWTDRLDPDQLSDQGQLKNDYSNLIWAATWQNQQSDCVPSEDSDQPVHPPVWSESSVSAWRKLGSLATHYANIYLSRYPIYLQYVQ